MSKPNPSYYAIVPATVRYDEDLVPNAKLLYGEITALTNSTGTCTASNRYFAKLYGVTIGTVSAWINALLFKGYIDVILSVDGRSPREIRIPLQDFAHTPNEKAEGPPNEKAEHNNTRFNNKAHTPELDDQIAKAYRKYLRYFISDKETPFNGVVYDECVKRYRLTPKRALAIERRLADAGFNLLITAIIGYGRADWSNGNNDRRWKADLADFICRSYENVERGARLYEEQGKAPADDAWAKLG